MPTCKNDCKRYYRGDEPSPKGLGYCAHAEKINQRRKGRDGKFWVVKVIKLKTGKRIRRWTRVKKAMTKKPKMKGGMMALTRLKRKLKPNDERQKELRHIAKLVVAIQKGEQLSPQETQTLTELNIKHQTHGWHNPKIPTSHLNQQKVDKLKKEMNPSYYKRS